MHNISHPHAIDWFRRIPPVCVAAESSLMQFAQSARAHRYHHKCHRCFFSVIGLLVCFCWGKLFLNIFFDFNVIYQLGRAVRESGFCGLEFSIIIHRVGGSSEQTHTRANGEG